MAIENHRNSDYVSYFKLEDYVKKIKLDKEILEKSYYTSQKLDDYITALSKLEENQIYSFFIQSQLDELYSTQKIENKSYDKKSIGDEAPIYNTLNISHHRIIELHDFITKNDANYVKNQKYREPTKEKNNEVYVGNIMKDGTQDIFWRGSNACDVKRFMDDFIQIYKKTAFSEIYSNPFISSSLMHLLFLRIHPFKDGNGRTARIIQNIRFTDMINKVKGTNLKLSPLNISDRILANKITYVNSIDDIYFDLEHDTNREINKFFDFMLNMYDEKFNYLLDKLANEDLYITSGDIIETSPKTKMRINKLK